MPKLTKNQFSLPAWQYQNELRNIDQNKRLTSTNVYVPARVDFIGGWTDTPPYFFDHPAAVLNTSIDCLGIKITINYAPNFTLIYNNKNQRKNLPVLTTLQFLKINQPKIKIKIINSIPRGSGLGGSSLLACGLLKALFNYYSIGISDLKLTNYTLEIEQMMGSGGGWQDQIGGLYPGIKLIRTAPQRPCFYRIRQLPDSHLEKLCLLIDTDIRRKAAHILYSIREKYLQKDPATIATLAQIQKNALLGWKFLQTKKYLDFGRLVSTSWQSICQIESASRLKLVNTIEKTIGQDLAGLKISGAGGGGFVLVILKNSHCEQKIIRLLKKELGRNTKIYQPKFI